MKLKLTLIALLALLAQSVWAFEYQGLNYWVLDEGAKTARVAYNKSASGVIDIPETVEDNGKTYTVTEICASAFRECRSLRSVTIPNSLITIGELAFYDCDGLRSVTIGNSVISIGRYAFDGCKGLTSVTIPNSVTEIGGYAFGGCSGLTSVIIGNSVTEIGEKAFINCNVLTSVVIPPSVTSIGENAFYNCSGLKKSAYPHTISDPFPTGVRIKFPAEGAMVEDGFVWGPEKTAIYFAPLSLDGEYNIPNSVTEIGQNTFYSCSGLTSVNIPNSVTSIGGYAFYKCSGLTSVSIGSSVTEIGGYAFGGCSGLTEITIPSSVMSIGGGDAFVECSGLETVNFNAENCTQCGSGGYSPFPSTIKNANFGESVKIIPGGIFRGCNRLTSIIIPDSVTLIGELVFYGCSGLTEVNIPNSVTEIGNAAFKNCTGLTSVTIGNSVTSIVEDAFCGCSGIKSVNIPNSVTEIGNGAFYNCSGLTEVNIPNSVTSIGKDAFRNCDGIKSVIIPNSVTEIGDGAFYMCGKIKSAYPSTISNPFSYGVGIKYPAEGAFIENGFIWEPEKTAIYFAPLSLEGDYDIPNSVTSIGASAFSCCAGIKSVTIPNSVTEIGNEAFSGCRGLTSITIPTSVTSIGGRAFSDCTNLETVNFNAENCTYCGYWNIRAFPPNIKVLNIGENVKIIPTCAFHSCSGLTSATIPNSVTEIGAEAFYGCSGLTSITIPNSVTEIGKGAFRNCDGIKSVIIPNSVTEIGDGAFYMCGKIKSAYPSTISNPFSYGVGIKYPAEGAFIEDGFVWGPEKTAIYFAPLSLDGDYDIPNSVTSIGQNTFYSCSGLTSVTIPNSVTSIGGSAFSGCSGLETVNFNAENCTYCGDWYNEVFPSNIKVLNIGENVNIIPAHTFYDCSGLTSVTIPNSVTEIGGNAFRSCRGLTSVTIGNSVASIGMYAFSSCYSLTSITSLNDEAPTIQANTFEDLYAKATAIVPEEGLTSYLNTLWAQFDNLCGANGTVTTKFDDDVFKYRVTSGNSVSLIKGDYTSMATVSIPERVVYDDNFYYVTSIGYEALKDCTNMSKLVLPKRLESIGDGAFSGCTKLTEVNLPTTLKAIGNSAFQGCTGFKKLIFPESLLSIGNSAFQGCSGLTSLTFPEGLLSIGNSAFQGCTGLTSLTCPSTLKSLGTSAFEDCHHIESAVVTCPVSDKCFYCDYISFLKNVTLTDGVTSIGEYAFFNNYNLVSINIPDAVTSIGKYAFSGCNLPSIDLPNSVTIIQPGTFKNCSSLTSFTVHPSVQEIGVRAFNGCSMLETFVFEDGTAPLALDEAFYECPITKLYVGRDLTYSGSGIKSTRNYTVTFGNTVTEIPDNIFNGSSTLKSVTFGSSIKSIGANAFNGCGLTELVLSPGLETIGENAFAGCDIKNITMGANVAEIGEKAFDGANSLEGVSITALTPPNANNNSFSYYDCPLYLTNAEAVDAYYNCVRCWYRFSGFEMVTAEELNVAGSTTVSLSPGETLKLTATVSPANASLPYVFWRSTNPEYVTVDKDGNVTCVASPDAVSAAAKAPIQCQIIAETLYADGPVATVGINVVPTPIPAESITLNKTAVTLKATETVTLTATVLPETTTDKTVTWSSSNTSIATVDANGKVTAVAVGAANITATCGEASAICKVTVETTPAESITLNKTAVTLKATETVTLTATVLPETTTDKKVTWKSSNANIATVDANGKVTAVAVGTATITATATSGVTATCQVTVEATPAESITLSQTTAALKVGESVTLTATVLPATTTDKTVTWTSSNDAVATVNANGKVTAVALCSATITATCGSVSASCVVSVVETPAESVTLDRTEWSGKVGETVELTATVKPDNATDKTVVWTSSNSAVATVDANGKVTAVAVGSATITASCGNVSASCAVSVVETPAENVTLDRTEWSGKVGESVTLTATVLPEDATDKTVVWTSSNNAVATVDANGKVTAVAVGSATITATCDDASATCEVTVVDDSTGIDDLDADTQLGDIYTLTGVCVKRNATVKDAKTLTPGFYIVGGKKMFIK